MCMYKSRGPSEKRRPQASYSNCSVMLVVRVLAIIAWQSLDINKYLEGDSTSIKLQYGTGR
jgi:hypothetical protein